MDEELYDQFGNYIGPQILSDSSEDQNQPDLSQNNQQELREGVHVANTSNQHRIVLHQDKKYYQTHQEMYPQAQIMIQQQDRQTLETPIIPKKQQKNFDLHEAIQTYYTTNYMLSLMKNPSLIRNICVAGHLHHGKSLILDMLIQQAHNRNPSWNLQKNYKWLDTRVDEQQRQLSIKATPITMLLPDFKQKNYVLNIIDTPGHPNFAGELVAGLRLCDGVMLVVDVVEGMMLMTQKIIKHCIRERLKVVIVLNKIDRLILQLRMPPDDAYLKIKHTLQQINGTFQKFSAQLGLQNVYQFSPVLNNVVFASAQYGFVLSLQSMTIKYFQKFKNIQPLIFKKILWGDYYFNPETKKFSKTPYQLYKKRTFVQFILQPIYKIFSHTVGKDRDSLQYFLAKNLQVFLSPEEYKKNIKTMVKLILRRYFKTTQSLVSSLVEQIPSPLQRTKQLINTHFKGEDSQFKINIKKCNRQGPLYINTVKMYHQSDYKNFSVFGRILSGTLKKGDSLKVMGQAFEVGDDEDVYIKQASRIFLYQGRYKIQLDQITAGNWVLIEGIDQAIAKTSTIVHANNKSANIDIMVPLKFWTQPTIKVAIQPLVPSELPKMIQAIRRVSKSYLLLKTKVEESGEHILIGTGQIFLDSVLHDIRNLYSDIEVRISDPCVTFCQTVIQTSGIPCYADTPNKKNRFTALAGPLEKGISEIVQKQLVDVNNKVELKRFLQTKFDWDILSTNNIWSFGPEINGPNALINQTIVHTYDQSSINRIKPSIIQGFKWSTRQGPLCDQPMRNVKFRLMQADLSKIPSQCPPGQIIPTTRRAFYSSFLTANPRMMEPVYLTQIQCTTSESVQAVFAVLAKRRGTVQNQVPKPGTPHYIVRALVPCIQALGFQTDLRVHTVGQAFCVSTFDHWQVLSGDPLDKKIVLRPLQVHQHHQLARQFMIKTRRRKGLNEQVSIVKYFDDLGIKQILKNDVAFRDFL